MGRGRRLARDDGVTVFLTTQYLEEADVLADRVGIIDHGHIVAEGTPTALKAEVGRPTVEVVPPDPADSERAAASSPASASRAPRRKGVAVRLPTGEADLADVVRALDADGLRIETSSCTSRRSTTSSSPRPAARSRAPATRRQRGAGSGDGGRRAASTRPGLSRSAAARSSARCASRPTSIAPLIFPLLLLAVNSGGLKAETHLPGFPTSSFVAFALAVPFIQGALFATMNAGTDLARDIQTGFLNRLALTPMRGRALLAGQLGGVVTSASSRRVVYLAVGLDRRRAASRRAWPGVLVLLAFAADRRLGVRRARHLRRRCAPAPARRCRGSSRCSSSSCSSRR